MGEVRGTDPTLGGLMQGVGSGVGFEVGVEGGGGEHGEVAAPVLFGCEPVGVGCIVPVPGDVPRAIWALGFDFESVLDGDGVFDESGEDGVGAAGDGEGFEDVAGALFLGAGEDFGEVAFEGFAGGALDGGVDAGGAEETGDTLDFVHVEGVFLGESGEEVAAGFVEDALVGDSAVAGLVEADEVADDLSAGVELAPLVEVVALPPGGAGVFGVGGGDEGPVFGGEVVLVDEVADGGLGEGVEGIGLDAEHALEGDGGGEDGGLG